VLYIYEHLPLGHSTVDTFGTRVIHLRTLAFMQTCPVLKSPSMDLENVLDTVQWTHLGRVLYMYENLPYS
jgi:hypothetical protein